MYSALWHRNPNSIHTVFNSLGQDSGEDWTVSVVARLVGDKTRPWVHASQVTVGHFG